jgi:hypothetical protein
MESPQRVERRVERTVEFDPGKVRGQIERMCVGHG